jgi:membrane-associated phospholipid phosphatase/diacylglycerol kinase family enzyme
MRLERLRHPIFSIRRRRVLPRWVRRADRSINRRVNAAGVGPVGDTVFRIASRAAYLSMLWFAIAGVLALAGKPRAALRGSASLVLASALANLVGKRLFGGPRPLWKDVPVGRRLGSYPTSASFPSGHSASAAAFVTGVALESPAVGAAVAPLAAAVAYSRVHVGAHWASDVLGGIGIGAAVAAVGAVILPPRRPQSESSVAETGTRVDLPEARDGEGLLIVLNEEAGTSVLHADPRPVFASRLPRARIREMGPDDRMDDIVREEVASATPPRVLVAYGGDGSVARMAQLAREYSLPLLGLPGGTFNHFVRALGVDELDVGLDAASTGRGLRVGVGSLAVGDDTPLTVLNTVSVGIYPDFVAERIRRQARWGKWIAAVVAAAIVVRRARPITVEMDGEQMSVWSVFASIGRNDPGRVSTMQRRRLSTGELDLRILHARDSRRRAFGSLAFGRRTAAVLRTLRLLPRASDVERRVVGDVAVRVLLRDGQVVPFAHDGELEDGPSSTADGYVLRLAALSSALDVYAP